MKLQNLFSKGTINKDLDPRFIDSEEMIDAENFFVNSVDGSNGGIGKNALGNALKTTYGITGGKTVGVGIDTTNNKVYNLVKGTSYDYVIEYDIITHNSIIVLQSSTGSRLNFKTGERVRNVDIIANNTDEGNIIAFSGDSNPPRMFNIKTAKTWGINGFTEDEISVMKPSPIFAPEITLTTSVDGVENNFIEDKFIRIAYRYKYADGFYSCPSSWSKVAFEPKSFELDYSTYENKGMLNLSNAVDIDFKTGPREVVEIELLFKESEKNNIYVIQNFNKAKEVWGNNTIQSFQLSKSKVFKILSEEEASRNFDNVPLSAVAQTTIMNRLTYANYIEGRNIDTNINFSVECVSTNPYVGNINTTISDFIDSVDYSNVVDFESGVADGGTTPVNQMNFTTNELNIDLAGADFGGLTIEITPKSGYSSVQYSIYVKEGTTVLASLLNVTGNQSKGYSTTSNKNIKVYITSSLGIIYDCKMIYDIVGFPTLISRRNYFAVHQLSFPKSTSYGTDLAGNTIINRKSLIDLTGYLFQSGQQIRINFELQSSLSLATKPSVTFFYNLTSNYTNLADFYANSSFKNQLEDAFSLAFRNNYLSNEGTIVSYQGFSLSYTGNTIIITTPKVVYSVLELSGITENKNEFFLTTSTAFLTVTENSFSSMHSNRDVELCMFYMDAQGRKTTALVSKSNSIYIPANKSTFVNKIKATVNHTPPSWAKYYKFGIKQAKRDYETIYGNEVYKEGIYRWIRLIGENKNKVKEGDLLIVKSDYSGPLEYLAKTKVIEVLTNSEDFIKGNKLATGADLIEQPGLYMKIKQGSFNMNIDQDSFQSFIGFGKRRYARDSYVTTAPLFGVYESTVFKPYKINAGSLIRFFVSFKAYGSIAFEETFPTSTYATKDYLSIKDWWEAEIMNLDSWTTFAADNILDWKFDTDGKSFSLKCNRNGTASRDIITDVVFDVNFAGGMLCFETEPFEDLSSPFFETPETFTINAGAHEFTDHILNDAYNCYAFGNGVESFKMQDSFLGNSFSIDINPSEVSKDGYKQVNRFADITYSGVFNSNSNVNKLNEFNLALANFKDDIDKSYGAIYKIKGRETNLQVYQEDKDSQVYYGKDVLYNADGSTNLSKISDVLGSQDLYQGDFGISMHADSYTNYGYDTYHTDVKRGVVIKKSNNGLFEISSQGMKNYFKTLFRDNVINYINGKYDQFNDYYILHIQYNNSSYVTWVYSDKDNGWLGKITFNPEDMCCVNGKFLSFKNGEIYEHNQLTNRNTFYGIESPSKFTFNFSQSPSERKIYKTTEIEGTDAWQLALETDLDKGYINIADFERQEGVYRAYTRTSNTAIDTSLLSCQGIGECSVNGLVLSFSFPLEDMISIGDEIRNSNLQLVGTILSKTTNSITLNAVTNIVSGDYVLCSKPQSAESQGLLGYHMVVTASLTKNTKTEVFAINTEVSKSHI
jgi:hypothetical protein